MGRALQVAALAMGLCSLILQFAISLPAAIAAGRSLAGSIVFVLSFFTILTNIGAVLVGTALLSGWRGLAFFARPSFRAGVAVSITLVMIIYATVLARLWQPQGLFLVCDVLLHYVTPTLFLAWWLGFGTDGSTEWRDTGWWVAYPLAYTAYALARAPIAGEVPYPFLDISRNGVEGVMLAVTAITLLFVGISALAIAADHSIGRRGARRG